MKKKMSRGKWSRFCSVAQKHHQGPSQPLYFLGLYPQMCCPIMETCMLHSKHPVHIQDRKKIEGRYLNQSPNLSESPQLVPNSPKRCHIVAKTAKQFGEATIFIWHFSLDCCVIILPLERPFTCHSSSNLHPVH